jgi:Anti-sigma-K factor rskA, C-terminal
MSETMQRSAADGDLRLSNLQTQIDSLSVTLQQWRQAQEDPEPMEQRLAQLTEQCAGIVERWRQTDERHTEIVASLEERLNEWGAIESRLQQDSGDRIRELEKTIEHEWQALRQLHEEPVKQLREQAATLGETCAAAANLALRGFERAESRIVALEQDLQARMAQLSQDFQAAIAQLNGAPSARPQPALREPLAAFPLDSVMRIHEELRESGNKGAPALPAPVASPVPLPARPMAVLPEAAESLAARMESLEARIAAARTNAAWWRSYPAMGLLIASVAAGAFAVWIQGRVESRLNDAAARVAAADRQRESAAQLANSRLAATGEEAGRQVAEARQTALHAQIVGNVLAAPDVIRFDLAGTAAAPRAYAKVMFSRSRGTVFSASRLPQAPSQSAYQFWLMTRSGPVSAGLLTPDAGGRVTFVTDTPDNVPRPVIGASVTLEPAGGRPRPSGTTVLDKTP